MNGNVKCVENQGKKSECMHVKCNFVVTVMWNNFVGIKFHFYHLVTILWGICFYFFIVMK
jgi:hypothetical protein